MLREGHRRHIIHGLVEVDVTEPRQKLASRAEDGLSFTGFVVACVARAVDEDKMMHAHRWGRRRLVLFEEVDVNLQLEQTRADGTRIVQSRLLRDVNHKTVEAISTEIRQAQAGTTVDRRRYLLVEGQMENRDHLSLTVSVDHDIIDGAPAARFVARLRELIESSAGL